MKDKIVLVTGASGGIVLNHTTVIQLDGKTIGEHLERRLFDSAAAFSSGFIGQPVTE